MKTPAFQQGCGYGTLLVLTATFSPLEPVDIKQISDIIDQGNHAVIVINMWLLTH